MVKDLKAPKKQSVTSSDKKPANGEVKTKKSSSKSKGKTLKVNKKLDSKPIKKEKKVKTDGEKKNRLVRRFNKLRLKEGDKGKGIVYIGHLPKGFEEGELRKFFEQFGKINKLRVSRSKKTGRTRGYAFLEFAKKDVAEIAVNTMDGYMLFHKKIECHLMDGAHKDTFKNGNRDWKYVPTQVMFRNKKNLEKSDEDKAARVMGLLAKEKEKRIRLKELGIEYDFPGFAGVVESAPKSTSKPKAKKQEQVVEAPKASKKAEAVKDKSQKKTKAAVVEEPTSTRRSSRRKSDEIVEESPKASKKDSKSKKTKK